MAPDVTYQVSTPVFSGPLELLLQLVTSHRVEITELSLTEVIDEFAAYMALAAELDLDITSEFLVIAATLIQMKARHLLPSGDDVELDEELLLGAERDRLLSRLLACLTYKDVAAVIAHRLDATARMVPRRVGLDPGIATARPEVHVPLDSLQIAELAGRVIGRRTEPDLDHLDLDLPSVALAIDDIRLRMADAVETDFEAVTSHLSRPVEVVAYFLAVLELARWGLLEARQDHLEGVIRLRHLREAADGDLVSEWSP
jgi:segregation and condensation protein A